jgi:hypothetical protein
MNRSIPRSLPREARIGVTRDPQKETSVPLCLCVNLCLDSLC